MISATVFRPGQDSMAEEGSTFCALLPTIGIGCLRDGVAGGGVRAGVVEAVLGVLGTCDWLGKEIGWLKGWVVAKFNPAPD